MTDVIHNAAIQVSLDSSQVEAGAQRINTAVERTSRTVAGLGASSNGFNALGAGADRAATQVRNSQAYIETAINRQISLQERLAAGPRNSSAFLEVQARQLGLTAEAAQRLVAPLAAVEAQQLRSNAAIAGASPALARVGMSAAATAAALRQVPAQLTDIIVGLQGGQAPLTVLLQQGGQLRDVFGSVGGAARALGGAVLGLITPLTVTLAAAGGLLYAFQEGATEAKEYAKSIALSGNAAGVTSGQLSDMARNVSKAVGTQGAAAEAITALVATGKVSAGNIEQFSAVAIRGQRALGQSVADTAAEFADLAKTPVESLVKLNEKYHFLTGAIYEQVRALQDQGRAYEAGQTAQQAFATAFDGMSTKVTENLGSIQRAANIAKDVFKGFWDAALNVGREDSLTVQLEKVRAQIAKASRPFDASVGGNAEDRASLKANQEKEKSLEKQIVLEATKSSIAADQAKFNAADLEWSQTKYQYMTRQQKLEFDLAAAKEKGLAAGISDVEIDKRLAAVRKQYSDIYNDGIDSNIAALKRRSVVEDLLSKRAIDQISFARNSGSITEEQAIERTTAAELAAFVQRKAALQDELALIKQKQNSKTAAADKQGEIDALEIQRTDRKIKGEDELFLLEQKRFRLAVENNAKVFESAQGERDSLRAQYQAQLDSNEAIGLTKVQLASLTAARLEELAVRKESNAAVLDTIVGREQEAEAMRASAQAFRNRAAAIKDGGMKEFQFDEWKKAVDTYSDVFRTGFADMLNNGKAGWKSFTKSLVTTFKTSVADQIYKMFAQPFVVKLVASLLGVSGSAATTLAQAAGGTSGATGATGYVGVAQSAKAAYDAISSGFAGLSTSVADGVQAGLNATGMSSNILTNGPTANFAGQMASTFAAYAAGSALNSAISGKYETGSGIMATEKIATAVASYINPVLGVAVGAISGVINRAFGMGPEEVKSRALVGSFSATGFAGSTDAKIHRDGGWFRSDRDSTRSTALDDPTAKALGSAYDQIKAASADFATTLGLNADSIKDRAQSLNIALTDDKAANQKAITDFFVGVGDTIAKELLPTISDFTKAAKDFGGEAETASAALQRIATDYAFIDVALASINQTFGSVGVGSIAARERLIDLSGGLDAFGKGVAGFAQNYLSEAERLVPVSKTVSAAFESLGLAVPETREQFKTLVQSLDLTTESGAATYAGLIKVQDGFAQLHPAMEALASVNKGYQDQIDELLKSSMSATELRAVETKGMDASTVALYDRLAALKGEAAATALASQAIQKAKDAAIESARQSAEAFQSFGNALVGTMTRATEAAKALRDFNSTLLSGSDSTLDLKGRRDVAAERFASNPGDTTAASALLDAAKALRDGGGGGLGYARDFAQVIASNAGLAAQNDARAAAIPAFYAAIRAQNAPPSFLPTVPAQIYSSQQSTPVVNSDAVSRAEFEQTKAQLAAALAKIASSTAATAETLDDIATGRRAITVEG